MYQAIQTKFLGPTNFRGSRYKATAAAGSVTLDSDHALNPEDNHKLAALALRDKYDWKGELVGGCLPNGDYAWVFKDK